MLACLIRHLVSLVDHEREWNFFQGKPILTTETYPCDLDTTSVALTVTAGSKEVISSVMDEMLKYVDKDGIVQVTQVCFVHDHPDIRFARLILITEDRVLIQSSARTS